MTLDPTGDRSARVTSALLRDARSLLRRADKLFAASAAVEDPATTGLATEARTAVEQLVHHLTRLEQQAQRRARNAGRRGR
jgi:CHASE3 domain sensor protein